MPPRKGKAIDRAKSRARKMKQRRRQETPEERNRRLAKARERAARSRASETVQQRETRLQEARHRARYRARRSRKARHFTLALEGFNYDPHKDYLQHTSVTIGKMEMIQSACPSSRQMELDDNPSSPQVKVEPDFITCSVKSEPEDVPSQEEAIKNTWEVASSSPPPILKSEPEDEQLKVEEPEVIGGSPFHVYLPSVTEMSAFLQEDSEHLDASDNITQFSTAELKHNESDNVEAEPEVVRKSELTIEDDGPATEADRLSPKCSTIRSAMHKGNVDAELSHMRENACVSKKNLGRKSLQSVPPNSSSTPSAVFGSLIDNNGSNLECARVKESTMFSVSKFGVTYSDCCKSDLVSPIQSSSCNTPFSETQHLKTSTTEKQFMCSICNEPFAQGADLVKRSRSATDEKTFVCSACNISFRQTLRLKWHARIHTGQNPLGCVICNKSFSQK